MYLWLLPKVCKCPVHHIENRPIGFLCIQPLDMTYHLSVLQGVAKKDPSTKTTVSSKRRNSFVQNFQRLLRRKFATDRSFVQYYESWHKWCDFWFLMRYFQVNAPLKVQEVNLLCLN